MALTHTLQTFSLTIGGVTQHLVSYYKVADVESGRLRAPSTLPELATLDISPEYLDKTHFRNPPKVEIGVDGHPRYRGEADDLEDGTGGGAVGLLGAGPLSSGAPLLTDGRSPEGTGAKRGARRYEPYVSPFPRPSLVLLLTFTLLILSPSSYTTRDQSKNQPCRSRGF